MVCIAIIIRAAIIHTFIHLYLLLCCEPLELQRGQINIFIVLIILPTYTLGILSPQEESKGT